MKFRNYLETISGIGIYPMISLIIFFAFFVGLLIYVTLLRKPALDKMRALPLQDGVVKKGMLSVLLALIVAAPASAQEQAEPIRAITGTEILMLVFIAVLVFLAIMTVITLVRAMVIINRFNAKSATASKSYNPIFGQNWWRKFSGVGVALTNEKDILIDGHDYDGIQELDNSMPPWLQTLFLTTVVIAAVYAAIYFTGLGDNQLGELDKEIAQAEIDKKAYMAKVGASMDENNVTLVTEVAVVGQGKAIFQEKCSACHGAEAGGAVGPNLTDAYWLHGGGIKDLFKVIKYGVPEKGMISWEKQLSPTDIQKVASFVLSIQGSKPANAKEPQGELVAGEQLSQVEK